MVENPPGPAKVMNRSLEVITTVAKRVVTMTSMGSGWGSVGIRMGCGDDEENSREGGG